MGASAEVHFPANDADGVAAVVEIHRDSCSVGAAVGAYSNCPLAARNC